VSQSNQGCFLDKAVAINELPSQDHVSGVEEDEFQQPVPMLAVDEDAHARAFGPGPSGMLLDRALAARNYPFLAAVGLKNESLEIAEGQRYAQPMTRVSIDPMSRFHSLTRIPRDPC
jgi:hypothetical protein